MSEIDLFDWAASRTPEKVIDLKARREMMRRWPDRLAGFDLAMARKKGKLPPAQIIRFPPLRPASPGSYSGGPLERARG
ncbi:MAG TPA: hypothetical protein VGO06_16630 [Bosea sp. (in: a-proteobacteria)]|jgi:hypothetical protein|uniref:hypothetical protein n=1 Tax=Bosea sp. (in: a-proteobacteria) TaxID=1871050 RepID=UPI002E16546D|nr:hypothetical protein [Bosea sp. (in: a-proteobacteria)]